jgi:hypothetical protein
MRLILLNTISAKKPAGFDTAEDGGGARSRGVSLALVSAVVER